MQGIQLSPRGTHPASRADEENQTSDTREESGAIGFHSVFARHLDTAQTPIRRAEEEARAILQQASAKQKENADTEARLEAQRRAIQREEEARAIRRAEEQQTAARNREEQQRKEEQLRLLETQLEEQRTESQALRRRKEQ